MSTKYFRIICVAHGIVSQRMTDQTEAFRIAEILAEGGKYEIEIMESVASTRKVVAPVSWIHHDEEQSSGPVQMNETA